MGNVLQAGLGQNPARQAALKAGLPDTIAAFTVNKVCGSGLKAVMLAAQAIRAGDADLIVAGGMESMSRAPYLLFGARTGWKFGDQKAVDAMIHDGLWCAFENWHMGEAAEHIADKCGIIAGRAGSLRRAEPSARAGAAWEKGAFRRRGGADHGRQRRQGEDDRADEGIRAGYDASSRSRSSSRRFAKTARVTAGNASMLSDGAAAVVVGSDAAAEQLGSQAAGPHRRLRDQRHRAEGHLPRPRVRAVRMCSTRRSWRSATSTCSS